MMRHIAADVVACGIAVGLHAEKFIKLVATVPHLTVIALILSIGANWEAGIPGLRRLFNKIFRRK